MPLLRYADLILLAAALPVFLLAGWPMLGYLGGAFAWCAQRGVRAWTNKKALESDSPARVAGIVTASMIGRGWLVALSIFGVGMLENDAGLAAGVLFVIVFTFSFTVSIATRPFDQPKAGPAR